MKKIVTSLLFLFIGLVLNAQVIDTARFRLDYVPHILNFQKINQTAKINDTVQDKVKFDYYITPQKLNIDFEPSPIKAAKMTPDILERLYRNYVKVGFGFPITPLAELSIHNARDKKNSFGLNAHHFSYWAQPIGKVMSQYMYHPFSDTRTELYFNHFFRKYTLYTSVGYNHEAVRFYGFHKYNPDYDENDRSKEYLNELKNNFHHLKAEVGFRSNFTLEEKRLKHDVRVNYDFLRTNHKDMEHHVALNGFLGYDARFMKISGSQNYRMDMIFNYINNNWLSDTTRTKDHRFHFELKPTMQFTIKEYHIRVGLGIPIIHSQGKTKVPLYPIAEFQLGVIPGIMNVYAGIDGKITYNTLSDLLYENPYIKPGLDPLRFTANPIGFNSVYAGIKGNLVKKLNYHLGARYSRLNDMAFFIIDTTCTLKNQFDIVYYNGGRFNATLNLNWEVINNLYLNFEANCWLYHFKDTAAVAWHKPLVNLAFSGKYVLKEKMIFSLNFDMAFGAKALGRDNIESPWEIQKMKPILDFGIGFEYLIKKNFSAFVTIDNIACQHYAKFYNFKSFGINAIVGITYSFGNESIKKTKTKK